MFVVVVGVNRVSMAVVHVVDVIAVLDGFVTAVVAVGVLLGGVLGNRVVLIVMVAVRGVPVVVVQVVDVIAVLDGQVAAVVAVGVFGRGVLGMEFGHVAPFQKGAAPCSGPAGSWTWVSASEMT